MPPTPAAASALADDAALMGRLAAGEQEALSELHDRYAALVYGACLRILVEPTAAEEAMSDVFIELWRRAATWDPQRGSLATWLLVLARSRGIDRLRRSGHAMVASTVEHQIEDDPGSPLLLNEQRIAVHGLLAELAPDQRRSLELAYWSGLSQSEIAARLDRPLGTVKTWIRDGLCKLRTIWTRRHGGGT